MSEQPIQDVNDGKPWSEMDLFDLRNSWAQGQSIQEIAEFLCRSGTVEEVGRKAAKLGLLGPEPPLPNARRQAVMAMIIPWQEGLGISYTFENGDVADGPIGPADWIIFRKLEREGKVSFKSEQMRSRFSKLRAQNASR